jgi:hypothetical protein
MIGNCQTFHAVGMGFFVHGSDVGCAVEEGKLGVTVEMGESGHNFLSSVGR